jgi:hypothetical protein
MQGDNGCVIAQLMITYEWSDWRAKDIWWIQSVYVHPAHRRQGLFRALYQHAKKESESAGACGLRLYADVENIRAHKTVGLPSPSHSVFSICARHAQATLHLVFLVRWWDCHMRKVVCKLMPSTEHQMLEQFHHVVWKTEKCRHDCMYQGSRNNDGKASFSLAAFAVVNPCHSCTMYTSTFPTSTLAHIASAFRLPGL